jgi:hypothetical protein
MSGPKSRVRQRELQQVIRSARNLGVERLEVYVGEARIVIPLGKNDNGKSSIAEPLEAVQAEARISAA